MRTDDKIETLTQELSAKYGFLTQDTQELLGYLMARHPQAFEHGRGKRKSELLTLIKIQQNRTGSQQ